MSETRNEEHKDEKLSKPTAEEFQDLVGAIRRGDHDSELLERDFDVSELDAGQIQELVSAAKETDGDSGLQEPDKDLLELKEKVDGEIVHAVQNVLFPRLPEHLVNKANTWTSSTIFLGIDAIGMAANGVTREQEPRRAILQPDKLGGGSDWTLDRVGMIREVKIMTKLDHTQAEELLSWILEAARIVPTLFPGAVATPDGLDGVMLLVFEREIDINLAALWAAP